MKLKRQVFLFTMISIIPLLLLIITFYLILVRTTTESVSEYASVLLEETADNLNLLLKEAENAAEILEHQPILQQALRERPELSSYDAYRIRMSNWLKFIHDYSTPRIDAYYVLGDYQTISSNNTLKQFVSFADEDWYRKIVDVGEPVWFKAHTGSFVNPGEEGMISMGAPIHDTLSGEFRGVLIVDIEEKEFRQIASINMSDNISVALTAQDGTSVYLADEEEALDELGTDSDPIFFSDKMYTLELQNGWVLKTVIPIGTLVYRRILTFLLVALILILAVLIVAIKVSSHLFNTIVKPIEQLQISMKQVEKGDLETHAPRQKAALEIELLRESFNEMVNQLDGLMKQQVQDQKAIQQAQMNALTAQINPHFLYNTLDTIAWNVRLKNQDQALDALYSLTRLFRISLSKGRDVIPLAQEFEHITMYLKLQAMRYSDILDYRVSLPPELGDFQTIKLVLQPLVENAIYHGIKEIDDRRGQIEVAAYPIENNRIEMVVFDNGAGMEEETVKRLNQLLEEGTKLDEKGAYGILNVNLRIRTEYGTDYGIRLESRKGEYTIATVRIPQVSGNAADEEVSKHEKGDDRR